jgi:hypothetical protein
MNDTLARATLRSMLTQSAAIRLSAGDMPMPSHEDRSNTLRLRVLDGEDLTPEEMLYAVNLIRQGRRNAEPSPKSARAKKLAAPEVLTDLLDRTMI